MKQRKPVRDGGGPVAQNGIVGGAALEGSSGVQQMQAPWIGVGVSQPLGRDVGITPQPDPDPGAHTPTQNLIAQAEPADVGAAEEPVPMRTAGIDGGGGVWRRAAGSRGHGGSMRQTVTSGSCPSTGGRRDRGTGRMAT